MDNEPVVHPQPEQEPKSPEIVFIDEQSPLQPFIIHGELDRPLDMYEMAFGGSQFSQEGYSEVAERQMELGRNITHVLNIQPGSEALDVGWGTNKYIALGLKEQGVNTTLLDLFAGGPVNSRDKKTPIPLEPVDGILPSYDGDMALISDPESALKDIKFDAILFNGSWSSSGNNWTVEELTSLEWGAKQKTMVPNYNSPDYTRYQQLKYMKILQNARDHLKPGGVLYLGSSRYAHHGGGYAFNTLPAEKAHFLDVIAKAKKLGAKKITIIGVSSPKLKDILQKNLTEPETKNLAEEMAFTKLFIIAPMFGQGGYELKNNKGQKASYDEAKAIINDPVKRKYLLQHYPQVAEKIRDMIERFHQNGKSVIDKLTQGIKALGDPSAPFGPKPEEAVLLEQELGNLISPQIGRVDAIAIQF